MVATNGTKNPRQEEREGLVSARGGTIARPPPRSVLASGLVYAVEKLDNCMRGKWASFLGILFLIVSVILVAEFLEMKQEEQHHSLPSRTKQGTYPSCLVCGEEKMVTHSKGVVSIPFHPKTSCPEIQQQGLSGLISPSDCVELIKYVHDVCLCQGNDGFKVRDDSAVASKGAESSDQQSDTTGDEEESEQPANESETTSTDASANIETTPVDTTPQSPYLDTSPYGDDDYGSARYRGPIDQIVRVDPPLTQAQSDELGKEWGKWEFQDPKASTRPTNYCEGFEHCDVPRNKFPTNAWQTDTTYLSSFLDQGLKLVDRALEAVLAEYGRGPKDMPDADFDTRSQIFGVQKIDTGAGARFPKGVPMGSTIATKSWDGLVRRVLHSIVTRDQFGVILGGHSAAAGHGNHFKQSYMMQFHKVAEPVFGLLGVDLNTRNLAQGGLGTLEHSLGARTLYGKDIDIMIWDSGMTEGRDGRAVDLFFRQALLAGDRVPLLMGQPVSSLYLHEQADADIGEFGQGKQDLIPVTENEEQVLTLPYAVRYRICDRDRQADLCAPHRWEGKCWVDGWEGYTPTTPQDAEPGGRASWHPGNREHQLTGRSIAFAVFLAIKEALTKWKEAPNYALADDEWHVSAYYDNIRTKLKQLDLVGPCHEGIESIPLRFCTTGVRHAASEFTPRPFPEQTSLQSIIVPASGGYGGSGMVHTTVKKQVYNGPGPHNPAYDIPEGQVDVLAIVSNGRETPPYPTRRRALGEDKIEPGLGLFMHEVPSGYCDGTWNMECGRQEDNPCLLGGHADSRGGILFGGLSGWIVMNLKDLREGLIMLKIESWHSEDEITVTNGWTTENGKSARSLRSSNSTRIEQGQGWMFHYGGDDYTERILKGAPTYCEEFRFEYAIDGKITSMTAEEFNPVWMIPVQRVVEVGTVLDDPNFAKDGPRDVQLAIRQVGCALTTKKAMKLTHVYWS